MQLLGICLVVQLSLAFGVAGLLWTKKFLPVFDVLLFPWAASDLSVRASSLAALGVALTLAVKLIFAS